MVHYISALPAALEEAHRRFETQARDCGLPNFTERLITNSAENGPNLVSFSDSVLDENPRKRLSTPRINPSKESCEGERVGLEMNLFALVRNFAGHMTLLLTMDIDFLELQPRFLEMLWIFDSGWQCML